MKRVFYGLGVCLGLLGCGRESSDITGVARGQGDDELETEVAAATSETRAPADAAERRVRELAELPRRDVQESARVAPNCQAPTSVGLSNSASGVRSVRLLWDPETGECLLDDVDGSPDGMLGIFTVRVKEEVAVLSSVGQWKYYASPSLDSSELPLNQPFTIYPYLGDWQFVASLEYNGELVELVDFAYLRGEGAVEGGERGDVEDQAPSEFAAPTLCAPKPEGGEAP